MIVISKKNILFSRIFFRLLRITWVKSYVSTKKYASSVPSYYAAVRPELRNPNSLSVNFELLSYNWHTNY